MWVPVNSRPGWQTALSLVYPVLGLATLVVVLLVSRRPAQVRVAAGGAPAR